MKTIRFLTLIFMVTFLTNCASTGETMDFQDKEAFESMDIVIAVRNAQSKGDHEEIADYYRKKTATYLSKAELHQKMAESYWVAYSYPIATHARSSELVRAAGHCTKLGSLNNRIAEQYLFLAREHQKVAEMKK